MILACLCDPSASVQQKCRFSDLTPYVICRSNSAEGPRDKGPKAEDSRGHGCHAQHLLHRRHQQHDTCGPTLLLKVHGHKLLRPRPQRLGLPTTQKVNTSYHPPPPSFLFCFRDPCRPTTFQTSFLFPSPDQKDVVLCDSVVVNIKQKKTEAKKKLEMGIASTRK